MRFEDLLGHESQVALLRRALASERLPHALIFQGQEGLGKASAAHLLAAALLCEHPARDERPCGECAACRKVAHRNHPDFMVIERLPKKPSQETLADDAPAEEEGGGRRDLRSFIVVDQIRELISHAAYAPREGRYRVFVVDPADRMNHEAQNALLKTLEEPPGQSILVLVASRLHLLLPTVRSRCLAVRFAPMRVGDLALALERRGIPREEAIVRAALAGGRQGRALTLSPEQIRQRREEILDVLERLVRGPRGLADLASMTGTVVGADEDSLLEGLDLVETLLRDAALAAVGGPGTALVHQDLAPRTARMGGVLGGVRAASLVRSVEKLRSDLRFNVNRTLVAEALLAAVSGGPLPVS